MSHADESVYVYDDQIYDHTYSRSLLTVFTQNPAGTEAGSAGHGGSQIFLLSTSLRHSQRK